MIKEWISEYEPKNTEEVLSALREIMQEVALAGLSRTNFSLNGTCIRSALLPE
jgi:cobalamin-dependent methionine synthase I